MSEREKSHNPETAEIQTVLRPSADLSQFDVPIDPTISDTEPAPRSLYRFLDRECSVSAEVDSKDSSNSVPFSIRFQRGVLPPHFRILIVDKSERPDARIFWACSQGSDSRVRYHQAPTHGDLYVSGTRSWTTNSAVSISGTCVIETKNCRSGARFNARISFETGNYFFEFAGQFERDRTTFEFTARFDVLKSHNRDAVIDDLDRDNSNLFDTWCDALRSFDCIHSVPVKYCGLFCNRGTQVDSDRDTDPLSENLVSDQSVVDNPESAVDTNQTVTTSEPPIETPNPVESIKVPTPVPVLSVSTESGESIPAVGLSGKQLGGKGLYKGGKGKGDLSSLKGEKKGLGLPTVTGTAVTVPVVSSVLVPQQTIPPPVVQGRVISVTRTL